MTCDRLREDQWDRLNDLMPASTKGRRGPRTDSRLFVDALLFMARFGGGWRDLPAGFRQYQSVKRRHHLWIKMGVLDDILTAVVQEADLEWMMIGATIERAHQHAAGTRKAERGRMPRVWAFPSVSSVRRASATTSPWPMT